jgi:hypothetical protein
VAPEPEGSSQRSQEPTTGPYPELLFSKLVNRFVQNLVMATYNKIQKDKSFMFLKGQGREF